MLAAKPLVVPDPVQLAAVQRLCDQDQPYSQGPEQDDLFIKAMTESLSWHQQRSAFFAALLRAAAFAPEHLAGDGNLASIPFIPATFFKTHELLSVAKSAIVLELTSSGTTGQKSQMGFDDWSLRSGQRMVDVVFTGLQLTAPEQPTNYLLYTYETEPDSKLGTAYTDNYLCRYAPVHRLAYGLRRTGRGGHDFDVFGCIETLQRYEQEGLPVRIFGFPSFLLFTLERMRDLRLPPLKLHPQSLVVLGGGWKGHQAKAIAKDLLYSLVEEQLGIPTVRQRDSFGSVEHAIPYTECAHHRFHVPVWSAVVIRDVRTFAPLPAGQPGFLQFLTPFLTSVPAPSVLMGDMASWFAGNACPCAIDRPFFIIHGRAGTSKNKSCAIAAAELLGR